jgi:hypothetical protein
MESFFWDSYFSDYLYGTGTGGGGAYDPDGDDDGDGILNRDEGDDNEEIVVTAGVNDTIVVIGPRWFFFGIGNGGRSMFEWGSDNGFDPYANDGSGGIGAVAGFLDFYREECSIDLKADIAARQVEQLIKSQPDWNSREYGAIIYMTGNGDIKIGPLSRGDTVAEAQARAIANGETSYAPRTSIALPGEFGGWANDDPARPLILAVVHSHPDIGYTAREDLLNYYPSDGDYFNMAKWMEDDSRFSNYFSNHAGFAQYILGPDGTLREFNAKDGKITAANDSDPNSRSYLAKDRPCSQ